MSLSLQPLSVIGVNEPLLERGIESVVVPLGGSVVTYKPYPASSVDSQNINWVIQGNGPNNLQDRMVIAEIPIRLTLTCAVVTTNGAYVPNSVAVNAGKDAPRSNSLHGAMSNLAVVINGMTFSYSPADVIHALTRFGITEEAMVATYSGFADNCQDNVQNYHAVFGDAANPLGGYAETSTRNVPARGAAAFTIVQNPIVVPSTGAGTSATVIIDWVWRGCLQISPMFYGDVRYDSMALYNINDFQVKATFLTGSGFRFWSHDDIVSTSGADTVFSNVVAASYQFNNFSGPSFSYSRTVPTIFMKYIAPNPMQYSSLSLGPNIPRTYQYTEYVRNGKDFGSNLAYGAAPIVVTSDTLQLSSIPSAVIVYARPSDNVLQSRCDLTDAYLALSNVKIQLGAQTSLLSEASQYSLYLMNVSNGFKNSFDEFAANAVNNTAFLNQAASGTTPYHLCGGPLKLNFGEQIQLPDGAAPGVIGNFSFQISATFENRNESLEWDALQMTMYTILIYNGSATVASMGTMNKQIGIISPLDVINASANSVERTTFSRDERMGSGFWDTLSNWGAKANEFAKDNKVFSSALGAVPHPLAQLGSQAAKYLGYGEVGGGRRAVVGGAMVNKRRLKYDL